MTCLECGWPIELDDGYTCRPECDGSPHQYVHTTCASPD